jgi:hypothetical protein
MVSLWTYTLKPTRKSLIENYSQNVTSGCFVGLRWSSSSAPSNPHHYLWFQSQARSTNSGQSTISLTPTPLQTKYLPLTTPSIPTCTPALGVPLVQSALPSITPPQVYKPLSGMLQKPTEPYQSLLDNGLASLSDYGGMIINTKNNFGLTSTGGIYGEVANATADIF